MQSRTLQSFCASIVALSSVALLSACSGGDALGAAGEATAQAREAIRGGGPRDPGDGPAEPTDPADPRPHGPRPTLPTPGAPACSTPVPFTASPLDQALQGAGCAEPSLYEVRGPVVIHANATLCPASDVVTQIIATYSRAYAFWTYTPDGCLPTAPEGARYVVYGSFTGPNCPNNCFEETE
jgi:hypothetical protein